MVLAMEVRAPNRLTATTRLPVEVLARARAYADAIEATTGVRPPLTAVLAVATARGLDTLTPEALRGR